MYMHENKIADEIAYFYLLLTNYRLHTYSLILGWWVPTTDCINYQTHLSRASTKGKNLSSEISASEDDTTD